MTTGSILRDLRLQWGMSQRAMATSLGITKSAWAMYERGERIPRDEVKIRIANYFGRTVQELFFQHIEHQ